MKELGESLYLERSEPEDRAAAMLLKRVLSNVNEETEDSASKPPSFRKKLIEWLREGNIRPIILLNLEEVETCARVIESQVQIAEETFDGNHPKGTSSPNDIRLAKGLLPEMQDFIASKNSNTE